MIGIIYYSEKNLLNLYEIIIPLIGALSEINDSMNNQFKKEIYKDTNFINLYILIMTSPIPITAKKFFMLTS